MSPMPDPASLTPEESNRWAEALDGRPRSTAEKGLHACAGCGLELDADDRRDRCDECVIEAACEVMHDAYEAAAVTAGWETQQRSRKPWADVPEANKATMRAAVAALLDWLDQP